MRITSPAHASPSKYQPKDVLRRCWYHQTPSMSEPDTDELRLLGSAIEVAAHGIVILTPGDDASGPRIAIVNKGFCTLYGATREEVIGETVVAFGIVERHQAIFSDMMEQLFD